MLLGALPMKTIKKGNTDGRSRLLFVTAGLGLLGSMFGEGSLAAGILEEVVVTAQKREQNIQDVGVSITAITGDTFRELGFDNVGDVASQAPNLNFSLPGGAGSNPSLSIRGVGISDFADTNEGPVAMYIDEVYLGSLAGQTANVFDIDRIEVLRGPQGTLYGRNTTGGLIHFLTKKPTDEFEGYGQLTLGSWGRVGFEGAFGGPLGENMRGRLSLFHDQNDGTQRDRGTGERGNEVDVTSYRGQLQFDLTDDLQLDLNLHGGKVDNKAQLFKHRGLLDTEGNPCTVSAVKSRQCFDAFGFKDPESDPLSVLTDGIGQTPLDIDTLGGYAKFTWAREEWEFVSITAYDEVDKWLQDTTFPGFIGSAPPMPIGLRLHPIFFTDNSQVTQEFRLAHTTDNLDWLVGFYYFDDNKDGGQIIDDDSRLPPGAPPASYNTDYDQNTTALALFAHSNWQFAEDWSLELGIRYSEEEKDVDVVVDQGTVFGGPGISPFTFRDDLDTSNISWNIGLDWTLNDDHLLFGNISRGFKSGGWNSGGLITNPIELAPFDDEILTSYEVGIKSTFSDGRVRVNASVFYYDYEDFQAFTQSETNGFPVSRLQNAGDATVKGAELEITLAPTDYFEAQLGFGWLDSETEDFLAFERLDEMGNPIFEDLSGTEMTLSPDFTANGLFRLYYSLFDGEISALISVNHSESYFFDSNNDPVSTSGDFTIWNARIAWKGGPQERFEIAAYVNNLTNEDYVVEGFNLAGGQSLVYNERRLAGVTLGMNF